MFLNEKKRQKNLWRMRIWLLIALAYASTGLAWLSQTRPIPFITPAPTAVVVEGVTADGMDVDAASHLERAQIYFDQGNITAASEAYEEAVAADPENPAMARAYARWGQLLAVRQRTDEALIRTERAMALAPEDAEVLAARAMALEQAGRTEEAILHAQQAIDLDPNSASGYAFLAEAYAVSARYEEALATAEHAVGVDPDNVWGWVMLGYVRETRAEYDAAITAYQEGLNATPLSILYVSLGLNHIYNPNLTDREAALAAALDYFQQATVVDPRNPQAYAEMATVYFQSEDYTNALAALDRGIEQNPSFARAYALKGTIFYRQRNFEGAIEQLEQAVSFGHTRVETYYLLGLAYAYLDQCDKGLPWLQRAYDIDPTAPPTLEGLRICGAPVEPTPAPEEPPPAP